MDLGCTVSATDQTGSDRYICSLVLQAIKTMQDVIYLDVDCRVVIKVDFFSVDEVAKTDELVGSGTYVRKTPLNETGRVVATTRRVVIPIITIRKVNNL